MSRVDNSYEAWDGDDAIPEAVWQSRYQRAMNGPKGFQRLKEMKDALEALPERRLAGGTISDGKTVCFVGALVAQRRARKLKKPLIEVIVEMHDRAVQEFGEGDDSWEDLSTTAEEARAAGLPWTVAWEWATLNDRDWQDLSDEERYLRALDWVDARLASHPMAKAV